MIHESYTDAAGALRCLRCGALVLESFEKCQSDYKPPPEQLTL